MIDELDGYQAFLAAMVIAALVTPLTMRLAHRFGAIDEPRERGLASTPTPRLGGLAIMAGAFGAALIWLPLEDEFAGILAGGALIVAVGALDDVRELSPAAKLAGQLAAGVILVLSGVTVENMTLPFAGAFELGGLSEPLTLLGLVAMMNVVNFSDGADGLAAGVCAMGALTFSVIAFDLGRDDAGLLAAAAGGAAAGFLLHNFHPARVFMGDSGSNLLGLLLGAVIIEGALKTNAVIALVFPLVILAVPVLDTGFVVAKRIKYGRPVYAGDSWHFHHRFANIGFSQRRAVLYLYAWSAALCALALALRFVPYSDNAGDLHTGWSIVLGAFLLLAVATSVYVVAVLEIMGFRRLRAMQLRRADPATSEHEIDARVARELETGEFQALGS